MARNKRKIASVTSHVKGRERKRKKIKRFFPAFDEDELPVDISDPSHEKAVSCKMKNDSHLPLSKEVCSEEEEELPMFHFEPADMNGIVKVQDIVWAKHKLNEPHWPAYVKRVVQLHIFVFYISIDRFSSSKRSHKKKRLDIIPYFSAQHKEMVDEGCSYFKDNGKKGLYIAFKNAVSLAKSFISFKCDKGFSTCDEIYNFFNTDGFSHLKKTSCESSSILSCIIGSDSTATECACSESAILPSKICDQRDCQQENLQKENKNSPRKSTKRKLPNRALSRFNKKSKEILNYILSNKCKLHIEKVLKETFPSKRMKHFINKPMSLSEQKRWEFLHIEVYFEDDEQQDQIMQYLRNFLKNYQRKNKSKSPVNRTSQLLFEVLFPEAVIWAISKLRKISYQDAEMVYKRGRPMNSRDEICMERTLTREERNRIILRTKELAKERYLL